MELVGYWTSCKEIWDIYQSVYLLRRPLGLPSCGNQLRKRMICNILSSLKDQLHRCRYPTATGEDPESEEEWWPRLNRQEPYEEALRVACQRALDTAEVLWCNIERLSQRMRGRSQTTAKAAVEVAPGVAAGLVARVILGVDLRVDAQSPLVDLHLGGGWPLENLRWSQTPKEVSRLLIGTLCFRCGGMAGVASPTNWAHQHGGQSSRPFWGWRNHKNSLTRFRPPSISPTLGWGPSWSKITLCLLPPNASTKTPSFQMNCHTEMYSNNQFS